MVGLVADGAVWLGADSAAVGDNSLTVRADPKVFARDRFVIGFTDSYRMGQLLRYSLSLPEFHQGGDPMAFMVRRFVEAVRACFRDGGFLKMDNGREAGGYFMVGFSGHLFTVDSDFQVALSREPYVAIGCAADIARGALYAMPMDRDPEERLLTALEAAQAGNPGVRAPFTTVRGKRATPPALPNVPVPFGSVTVGTVSAGARGQ